MNNDHQTKLNADCYKNICVAFADVQKEKRKRLILLKECRSGHNACRVLEAYYKAELSKLLVQETETRDSWLASMVSEQIVATKKEIEKYQDKQRSFADIIKRCEPELKDFEERESRLAKEKIEMARSLALLKERETVQNLPPLKSPWPRLKFIGHACPGGIPGLGKRN